jgi:predicted DNA-binding transcriptional regulator AlpA
VKLELVGLHEAAELLHRSKSAIRDRMRAGTFPAPVAELRCGPVWLRSQIDEHAAQYQPRRGGGYSEGLAKRERGPGAGGTGIAFPP